MNVTDGAREVLADHGLRDPHLSRDRPFRQPLDPGQQKHATAFGRQFEKNRTDDRELLTRRQHLLGAWAASGQPFGSLIIQPIHRHPRGATEIIAREILRRPKEESARRFQFASARKAQPNEYLLSEFFSNI